MNDGTDTKKNLAETLKRLMKHKRLDRITIREITDECGYNRQTFYYHFEDIYDLLRWIYRQDIIRLQKLQQKGKSWQEEILILLDWLTINKEFCVNTLNSLGHRNLKRFFYEDIYGIVSKFINSLESCSDKNKEYKDFLTHFYTISLGALMENWVLDEIDKSPQYIVNYLSEIIK